jgi:thiol-disulfide isomerase/thioredoxin
MKIILSFTLLFICQLGNAQKTSGEIKNELYTLHIQTNRLKESVFSLIEATDRQIKITNDTTRREVLRISLDSLYNIYDENEIAALKIDLAYAKKHPASIYCFELVQKQIARQPAMNFYNDFQEIYNKASKEVKASASGKKMAQKLEYFRQSKVGSWAPVFCGVDMFGKTISLKDFVGKKYVLIDFWASWCIPCRQELPQLKALYNKYQSRDFEIISISTDEDLTRWKDSVLKEGIENWKNSSITQNKSKAETDYFVNGIPHKVLIDKDGVIIGKWKGNGELNGKSLQTLLTDSLRY